MRNNLKDILKGKVVIVGMGTPLRADDAVGLFFIEALQRLKPALPSLRRGRPACTLINAGTTPESYAGKIIKENPDTVLLVDAVHLSEAVGEYVILNRKQILTTGFTTHDLSPKLFLDYLAAQTKAVVYLLAIQPGRLTLGEEMSQTVKATVDKLADRVGQALEVAGRE